jgi:hypothetical protein
MYLKSYVEELADVECEEGCTSEKDSVEVNLTQSKFSLMCLLAWRTLWLSIEVPIVVCVLVPENP